MRSVAQQSGYVSPDGLWLWNGSQWVPNSLVAQPIPGPAWIRPYEPARTRAMLVTIFLAANIVGLLISMVFDVVDLGSHPPGSTAEIVVGLLALITVVAFYGTYIPAIVLFCMWVHRVVRNMPALGATDPRWSPAGAVGRCFIPFLNFAHPMSGTLEAWRGSDASRRYLDISSRKAIRPPAVIVGWWTLWLVGALMSRISFQLARSGDAGTVAAGSVVDLAASALLIGAAVMAVLVVREVTARQERKNELIAAGQLA